MSELPDVLSGYLRVKGELSTIPVEQKRLFMPDNETYKKKLDTVCERIENQSFNESIDPAKCPTSWTYLEELLEQDPQRFSNFILNYAENCGAQERLKTLGSFLFKIQSRYSADQTLRPLMFEVISKCLEHLMNCRARPRAIPVESHPALLSKIAKKIVITTDDHDKPIYDCSQFKNLAILRRFHSVSD